VQKGKDRDNYRTLSGSYSGMLDALERLYAAGCEHAYVRAYRPGVKVECEGSSTWSWVGSEYHSLNGVAFGIINHMHIAQKFEALLEIYRRPDGRRWSGQEID
jgi:hypothetical protein